MRWDPTSLPETYDKVRRIFIARFTAQDLHRVALYEPYFQPISSHVAHNYNLAELADLFTRFMSDHGWHNSLRALYAYATEIKGGSMAHKALAEEVWKVMLQEKATTGLVGPELLENSMRHFHRGEAQQLWAPPPLPKPTPVLRQKPQDMDYAGVRRALMSLSEHDLNTLVKEYAFFEELRFRLPSRPSTAEYADEMIELMRTRFGWEEGLGAALEHAKQKGYGRVAKDLEGLIYIAKQL